MTVPTPRSGYLVVRLALGLCCLSPLSDAVELRGVAAKEQPLLRSESTGTFRLEAEGASVEPSLPLRLTILEPNGGLTLLAPEGGWDWSPFVMVAVDLRNESDRPVTLLGRIRKSTSAIGFLHLEPGAADTMAIYLKRPDAAEGAPFETMRGLPGGRMRHWDRTVAFDHVPSFTLRDLDGASVGATITVTAVRGLGDYGILPAPGESSFFPFVDRYGQYKHEDWPGKIHTDEDLQAARERESAELKAQPGPADRSRFGGWKSGPRLEATGHFRTTRHAGKWWLVDPEGYLFWSHGATGVGGGGETSTAGRKHYFEDLPEAHTSDRGVDFFHANLERKYGRDWRAQADDRTHRRLQSWGMNTLGNWSSPRLWAHARTPYVIPIGYRDDEGENLRKDPTRLRRALRERLEREIGRSADDPWCLGYFVDNELKWDEVMDPETYYRIVSEEVKRAAPHKLFLGSRLHGQLWVHGGPPEAALAAAKYCDVVGINRYRFSPADLRIPAGFDKPIIIGEFHFGALDRGLLHPGLRGVSSQAQRAAAYRHYLSEALRHPNIVGTHWFRYKDQAITGRRDGENYQIGLVDIADSPETELVEAVREIGAGMYARRLAVPAAFPLPGDEPTVTIGNGQLAVTLARNGAELQSIRHLPTGVEYLWQGDPAFWGRRAPNMFPVNVRFKDNRFTYQDIPYEMPRMGIAINAPFITKEPTAESVRQVFRSSDATLVHYPFPFTLEIASTVRGLTLEQAYTVSNTGSETLYFALGGHPGFRTPLDVGRERSDYAIVFSQAMTIDREEVSDSLLTGKRIPYLHGEDRLALDDARIPDGGMFLRDHDSRQIGVARKGRPPYVTVELGDFPHTNLWTPPGMPYVCIEPMLAHHDLAASPDAIEEKSYLIALPAGEARSYRYSITIHPDEGLHALGE